MNIQKYLKNLLVVGVFLLLCGFFGFGSEALASNSGPNLGLEYPAEVGLSAGDVRITVAKILRVAMGLLGIIFVVIVLYGGYEWMTSGGNDEKVSQAKKRIYTGVIGLAIILASYSLTSFVIKSLTAATFSGNATSIF